MPNCAVVQSADNVVVNKIVAEVTDLPYEDTYLIIIPEGSLCDMDWTWDSNGNEFIPPVT